MEQAEHPDMNIGYLDELDSVVRSSKISKSDICLIGSSVLADYDIRPNNDLDIAVCPTKRPSIYQENLPEEIELSVEKYQWLGINDRELIDNNKYHYKNSGLKIVLPEVEYGFKYRRRRTKDMHDVQLIKDNLINSQEYNWNWDLVSYYYYPEKRGERGLPTRGPEYSRIAQFERVLRRDGLKQAVSRTVQYLSQQLIKSSTSNSSQGISYNSNSEPMLFLVWGTVSNFYEGIKEILDSNLNVMNSRHIEIKNVRDFINDIYALNETEVLLEYKAQKIKEAGGNLMAVKASQPVTSNGSFNTKYIQELKEMIRKQYYPYVCKGCYHTIIHAPESREENKHLSNVLNSYSRMNDMP